MKKYLVVYYIQGEGTLANVGIFHANTEREAEESARQGWSTVAKLEAKGVTTLVDGWSFLL